MRGHILAGRSRPRGVFFEGHSLCLAPGCLCFLAVTRWAASSPLCPDCPNFILTTGSSNTAPRRHGPKHGSPPCPFWVFFTVTQEDNNKAFWSSWVLLEGSLCSSVWVPFISRSDSEHWSTDLSHSSLIHDILQLGTDKSSGLHHGVDKALLTAYLLSRSSLIATWWGFLH